MSHKILVEVTGQTAVITINNPSANTWDKQSLMALKDRVTKLNENKEICRLGVTSKQNKKNGLSHQGKHHVI